MSVYSESDAANHWCPFVRVPVWPAQGSVPIAVNRDGVKLNDPGTLARCLASKCMAWRWQLDISQEPTSLGYCGLAGDKLPNNAPDYLYRTAPGTVSLASNQPADILTYEVPPGDWDLNGEVVLSGTSTSISVIEVWISLTSLTPPPPETFAYVQENVALAGQTGVGTGSQVICGPARLVTVRPTTVYLSCRVTFSRDTVAATGSLRGRRLSDGGVPAGSIGQHQPTAAARITPPKKKGQAR